MVFIVNVTFQNFLWIKRNPIVWKVWFEFVQVGEISRMEVVDFTHKKNKFPIICISYSSFRTDLITLKSDTNMNILFLFVRWQSKL